MPSVLIVEINPIGLGTIEPIRSLYLSWNGISFMFIEILSDMFLFYHYNYCMFFQKDDLSKFDFISTKEFFLALFLMIVTTIFSYLGLPVTLKKTLPAYTSFFNSYYFAIFLFFLSAILSFYIMYYFCSWKKQKTLKEGLFFYPKSRKTYFTCILIGVIMPLITLPIIFHFAPKEFYAMNLTKTKGGLVYLFTCALVAPLFEEIFYRGFIFAFFQSKINSYWAIIITGIFFALSHFMNIGNAHILLSLFTLYGFVLTLIRYFTNSLIPPMITHFVHNATLIVSFLVMSKISS